MNRSSFPFGQSQGYNGYPSQSFNGPQGSYRGRNHYRPKRRNFDQNQDQDLAEMIADHKKQKEDEKAKLERDALKKELKETIDEGLKEIRANATVAVGAPNPKSSPSDNVLTQILLSLDTISNKVAAQENTIASVLALQSRSSSSTAIAVPPSSVPFPAPPCVPAPATTTNPALPIPSTGITEEFVLETARQVMARPSPLPDKIQILWFQHMTHLDTLVTRQSSNTLRNVLKELFLPAPARLNHLLFRQILTVYRLANSIDVYADLK